jgi:macrolide-specific efflux system membrane fusion protein
MPPAPTYRFLGLLAAALTVAACSRSADHAGSAQAAPVAQPQFAAMARGRVDVEGGLVRIAAPRDGVIAELRVAAGDAVKQGDLIAVIDARQAELAADVAKAELDQAQARAAALRAKTSGLKLRASRVSQAAEAGAATGQSADDANQALTELNADIAEADAAVEVARQHLKQARYEVEVRSVRAPVAGRIVSRPAHIADVVSVQSGSELATLLPDTARIVRAELNEAFVAKVAVGMNATIVTETDSGKSWPAKVIRIGDVFGPSKLVEDAQETTDARDVECILELSTNELRVGQRVQVRFLAR